MKYFVLAGEPSGDKQGALLCKAISQTDPKADIRGWGGELMQQAGTKITKHYNELAFMGFVEVIRHLPEIFRNIRQCKKEILTYHPDALILVDYPGFNLRIAKWANANGYKVFYYISPQLWAWHTSRVKIIQAAVTKMYVILPFEKEFYAGYNVDVLYIGHPLAFEIGTAHKEYKPQAKRIALLPGSRRHEIMKILPEMKQLASMMPDHQFTVIAVSHLPESLYSNIIGALPNVIVSSGQMQETLLASEAAIVTSGTATLETAITGVPQIVVYKGNAISFWLAKKLVNVKYISLVNLILDQKVVPELIQQECNAENMHEALEQILQEESSGSMRDKYDQLRTLLMSGGGPVEAAADIYHHIQKE